MNLFIIFTISADSSRDQHANKPKGIEPFQTTLMRLFFADITEEGKKLLSMGVSDPVQWDGVTCVNSVSDVVIQVSYYTLVIGNFAISYLPSTVTHVYINECRQFYEIETRKLPRRLRRLTLYKNDIYGTLDLSCLPPDCESVILSENFIDGPIFLTDLPIDLRTLDLRGNIIEQAVVPYGNLPIGIEKILLKQRSNTIKGVRPVRHSDLLPHKTMRKIFDGMTHK